MLKRKIIILIALILPTVVFGVGKTSAPPTNVAATPIAGADASSYIVPIRVDANGFLLAGDAANTTVSNGNVNISSAGATARTQMTSLVTFSCTIQAYDANVGAVYVGGGTVTNASGTNRGIKLNQGDVFGPFTVSNLNEYYVATDNANDDVAYLCK